MKNKNIIITGKILKKFEKHLLMQEFSANTIKLYITAIKKIIRLFRRKIHI